MPITPEYLGRVGMVGTEALLEGSLLLPVNVMIRQPMNILDLARDPGSCAGGGYVAGKGASSLVRSLHCLHWYSQGIQEQIDATSSATILYITINDEYRKL